MNEGDEYNENEMLFIIESLIFCFNSLTHHYYCYYCRQFELH